VDATSLLEVGELGDFEAVEHHLPSDSPCAKRGRFPIVFLESDVMLPRIDAARLQAFQIELLDLVRRRLENHLKLMVLEKAIGILAESPVCRTARPLDVRHPP